MEREIKFRAQNFGGFWRYSDKCKNGLTEFFSYFTTLGGQDDPILMQMTLGQFTGLKDKNGKEIYEGDIFNMGDSNIKYVVEWLDCGLKGRQLGNKSWVGLDYWNERIEVIGNIYENPELLEGKE